MTETDDKRVRAGIEAVVRQVTPSQAPLAATLQRAEERSRRQRRAVSSSLGAIGLLAAGIVFVLSSHGARQPQPVDGGLAIAPIASSPLSGRAYPTVVTTPNGILYWGGITSAEDASSMGGPEAFAQDGAIFDSTSDTWAVIPDGPLPARYAAPAVWTGQSVLFAGGQVTSRGLQDAALYFPASEKWERLPAAPNCPLRMLLIERRVYAFGQCDGQGGENASYFDLDKMSWTRLPRSAVPFPSAVLTVDGSPAVMDGHGLVEVLDGTAWRSLPTLPRTEGIDNLGIAVGNVGSRVVVAVNSNRGTSSAGPADIYELRDGEWSRVGETEYSPRSAPSQAATVGDAFVFTSPQGVCFWRQAGQSGCQAGSPTQALDRDAAELAAQDQTLILWGGIPITEQDAPPPLDRGVMFEVG